MTKKQMIDYIKESGMIVNFSYSYLMHLLKENVERLYKMAQQYNERKVKESI